MDNFACSHNSTSLSYTSVEALEWIVSLSLSGQGSFECWVKDVIVSSVQIISKKNGHKVDLATAAESKQLTSPFQLFLFFINGFS